MATQQKRLRRDASAFVRTTDTQMVRTAFGAVETQAEVFIEPGGLVPDNILPESLKVLEDNGLFDPVPPLTVPGVPGVVEPVPPHVQRATAPPGKAVANPSDLPPTDSDVARARERLEEAQQQVQKAVADSQAEALADEPAERTASGTHVADEGGKTTRSRSKPAES